MTNIGASVQRFPKKRASFTFVKLVGYYSTLLAGAVNRPNLQPVVFRVARDTMSGNPRAKAAGYGFFLFVRAYLSGFERCNGIGASFAGVHGCFNLVLHG